MDKIEQLEEKVKMYESLLHKIQLHACVTMDDDNVRDLISNICDWSYAHCPSNSNVTETETDQRIRSCFLRLLNTRKESSSVAV